MVRNNNNFVVRWRNRDYNGANRFQVAYHAWARNVFRRAIRNKLRRNGPKLAREIERRIRRRVQRRRENVARRIQGQGRRQFYRIQGTAAGTTHTTCRMIVRRTPREQRFLRKMFKNNPVKNKYVNRFGFAWMGARAGAKTIWYSVCHLKFNNVAKYMMDRNIMPSQTVGSDSILAQSNNAIGNGPDAFIYIGKCTFTYELYNPTNYIMTVFIYDLICKRDTPDYIQYSDAENDNNCAPEACMQRGAESVSQKIGQGAPTWIVGDSTLESGTFWNSLGMKPTDYHYFNTFWKVKGMKKIVLPPTSSHHHTVVFNPKKKITNASLYFPRAYASTTAKYGIAGLTQATLFGFQGQVAVENDQSNDNSTSLSTLPGKLIVNCVKKINIWNMPLTTQNIISENDLKTEWTAPKIFTDLIEQTADAV